MQRKKNLINNKGFTLIELLITLTIFVLVLSIGYAAFSSNYSMATGQLKESSQRNDVLTASGYLSNDIRYSKSINVLNDKKVEIVDKDNVNIVYSINNISGSNYLIRQKQGVTNSFKEISDVQFALENANLVSARLYTDTAKNKYNDYKINRWAFALSAPKDDFISFITEKSVFVYGNVFNFFGGSVYGPNSTILIKGDLLSSDLNGGSFTGVKTIYVNGNVSLDGGSAGLGYSASSSSDPGAIYISGNLELWSGARDIYGDVYVKGNLRLKDARMHGNVYVNGNVELGWTPQVDKKIEYTGMLTKPDYYDNAILSKCFKVDSTKTFTTPDYPLPSLRSDPTWYRGKGYVSDSALSDGIKILSDNYYSDSYLDSSNVTIVSRKDINLTGWRNISGVLFAPNGKITFSGASFTGIAISRDGFFVTSGGSKIYAKEIEEVLPDPEDYPFEVVR